MEKKIKKAFFELSRNSRITTKELSKKIKTTQQSASYLLNRMKKRRMLTNFNAMIDPARFGLTNVVVGYNFLDFTYKTKKEIWNEFYSCDSVISIQESSFKTDVIVEYSVNNLSAFNKMHSEIIQKFHAVLEPRLILPVIVKHYYDRKYLVKRSTTSDMILCGDRDIYNLSLNEYRVLIQLLKNPVGRYVDIAGQTSISAKTVINIKNKLIKEKIIKGFSCTPNLSNMELNRHIILLKLSGLGIGQTRELNNFCKVNKNIICFIKTIGEFQVMLVVEELQKNNIIRELRSRFMIQDFFMVEVENIRKNQSLPQSVLTEDYF